ncbi:hypothetical protein LX15_006014 [Streptoalloteichus tenebrarius]|uniref:Uncharacterized protein n=1 Tax=Streptoalloteichus tenebrarius (strain ATCC 17920 / DSM 40477 / JCM 4838 / CBS 697.72 / NBRC 16177 / NCIMB 11028 / NRRL B-12390 / A12253. 1 / ISP 5477) TaxID=1933 RepID=A0ABT1I3B0_STRSD|nr:hypothetical protein [Streptoalloteichus tenebrarius]MCP2262278.1 hypothetical protein [Streptoalloteichus tenebrarius]
MAGLVAMGNTLGLTGCADRDQPAEDTPTTSAGASTRLGSR